MQGELVTTIGAYEEAVLEGAKRGHPDALALGQVFRQRKIDLEPGPPTQAPGIPMVDAELLELARSQQALLLTGDEQLKRRAKAQGLRVLGSPSFLLMLAQQGHIPKEALKALHQKGRISTAVLRSYLEEKQ